MSEEGIKVTDKRKVDPETGEAREVVADVIDAELDELMQEAVDEQKEALKTVKYPGYSRDIVSFGLVKDISAENGAVAVVIELTGGTQETAQQIKTEAEQAIRQQPDVQHVYVDVKAPPSASTAAPRAAAALHAREALGRNPGERRAVDEIGRAHV